MHLKDVWRSAGMKSGELCVMISGQGLMEPWLAGSWDFLQQVLHLLQEWNFEIVSSVLAQHICRVQFNFFVQVHRSSIAHSLARALVLSS